MGEVNARIFLREKSPELGWTYTHWVVNFGKGEPPVREDVRIVCAETSQRFMSRDQAAEEAKVRIRHKVNQTCGEGFEASISWDVRDTD